MGVSDKVPLEQTVETVPDIVKTLAVTGLKPRCE